MINYLKCRFCGSLNVFEEEVDAVRVIEDLETIDALVNNAGQADFSGLWEEAKEQV